MYDFGLVLKELRSKKGYSQAQVAQKINKSKAVISRYESNQQTPPLETLVDLAVLYHVSLDYLVGIDKHSLLTVGLSANQISLLNSIVIELNNKSTASLGSGMSLQQLQIINKLIMEFITPK